jgi:hypothetical protein
MRRIHAIGLLPLLFTLPAGSVDLSRSDFAYGIPVETDGRSAVYSVRVPLAVYQNTARADLGDIRVLNGRGEVVPYGLRRASGDVVSQGSIVALPLFPLHGSSVEPSDALKLRLEAAGASVEIERIGVPATQGATTVYLIDARDVTGSLSALELAWDPSSADFSARARIEASDDLAAWRRVAEAPVVNLHYAGQQFLRQRIEFTPLATKYIRLSWADASPAIGLTVVSAEPAAAHTDVARDSLTVQSVPVRNHPGEYLVDLGAHVPLDRVNLRLPEVNTLLAVDFDARADAGEDWRPVTDATLYRLRATDGSELENRPVFIPRSLARYWRVRVAGDGGGLGRTAPVFAGGWLPDELVFVARDAGPFELVYGNGSAPPATVAIQSLLPQVTDAAANRPAVRIGEARLLEPVQIGGPARLESGPRPIGRRVVTLWAILVLGVGSLGWMAWRLLRQMPNNSEPS